MESGNEGNSGDLGQPGGGALDAGGTRAMGHVPGQQRATAGRGHRGSQRGHRNAQRPSDTRTRASRNHDQRGSTEGDQRS
jgi:hypothetical protein